MPESDLQKRWKNDIRFVQGWLKRPRKVGSITPTGKSAAALMASFVDPAGELPVLEIGPGTGPVTKSILATGLPPERLFCVEYSSEFCQHLEQQFPQVNILNGNAFDLDGVFEATPNLRFSAVLSGLPLLNFPSALRRKLITDGLRYAAPGTPFVQLCYGPRPPYVFESGEITCTPTKWVLANIPPARFWVYRAGPA